MPSLGAKLFECLNPSFFKVLSGPNARLYLDVIDRLQSAFDNATDCLQIEEALEVIESVLEEQKGSAALDLEEEDGKQASEGVSTSRIILRRLITTGWLEEERRSDYRQLIFFEPAALTLLEALRAIVTQSVASFTGRLRLVCDRLAALRHPHSRQELIWEQLRHCLDEVKAGLRELRGIRKQVEQFARRQLTSTTLTETLDLIYNEFSSLITQQCYRELIHARLPERLREAMEGLRELEQDDLALQNLSQDYARTHPDASRAMAEILGTIEAIATGLGDVEPTADRVDAGTADFARRSRARIRYIQDVGSARRQQVKILFDFVRTQLSSLRLADLDDKLPDIPLRLSGCGLIGTPSLARRRMRGESATRQPAALPPSDAEREESLREMEKNVRNALRLDRANKFIERLGLQPGETLSSEQLPIRTEDDILDVLSCLVFAAAGGANYRLRLRRETLPREPVLSDHKGGYFIERFEVERK